MDKVKLNDFLSTKIIYSNVVCFALLENDYFFEKLITFKTMKVIKWKLVKWHQSKSFIYHVSI